MRKILCALLVLSLLVLPVHAEGTVEIRTPQELADIAKNPAGSYILMNDLDMTGVEWKSLDFSGKFDGNGKSILNLTITAPGDKKTDSYDGNAKTYPTTYFGFFGLLENAEVKGLNLVNVRAVIACDDPCYLGGLAGGMKNATVDGCNVSGVLELRAHNGCFGVGGIIGFGTGKLTNSNTDVTLICTDTDAETKDEQFMGGLYACGAIEMSGCTAKLDGYISEHGYVHSGGMIGMFMPEPGSQMQTIMEVMYNTAEGKITFFEDNRDRRAYCKGDIGEVLGSNFRMLGNVAPTFLRDEKYGWDVTQELRPEMCATPSISEHLVPATCQEFGYMELTCAGCGHTERNFYTLKAHTPGSWTVVKEPTEEAEGVQTSQCTLCGAELSETIPKLEPVPETEETIVETHVYAADSPEFQNEYQNNWLLYTSIGCAVFAAAMIGGAVYFRRQSRWDEY